MGRDSIVFADINGDRRADYVALSQKDVQKILVNYGVVEEKY